MNEGRRFVRIDASLVSNIQRYSITKELEEELKLKIINISAGGVYLATDAPYPKGTLLDFDFQLPKSNNIVRVKGMVTWIKRDLRDCGMGIKFINISTADKTSILKYIEDRMTNKGLAPSQFGMSDPATVSPFESLIKDDIHKDFLQIYFREIGFELEIEDVLERLECEEGELDGAFKTFESVGVVSIEDSVVNFYYAEDKNLRTQIEKWIHENGME